MATMTKERTEDVRPAIMTKPLPQILSELEDYIGRVEDAVKQAKNAASESREAAAQAKAAGESAAEAARKAAENAVAKVREDTNNGMAALNIKISGMQSEINALREQLTLEAQCLDKAFDALKARHMEESPFLTSKTAGKAESTRK